MSSCYSFSSNKQVSSILFSFVLLNYFTVRIETKKHSVVVAFYCIMDPNLISSSSFTPAKQFESKSLGNFLFKHLHHHRSTLLKSINTNRKTHPGHPPLLPFSPFFHHSCSTAFIPTSITFPLYCPSLQHKPEPKFTPLHHSFRTPKTYFLCCSSLQHKPEP